MRKRADDGLEALSTNGRTSPASPDREADREPEREPDRVADRSGAAPPPRWELYRVLAEPVRLRLLALVSEEELAIGELAELLDESQPNVSRHAAPLRQAGLVRVRRQGTRTLLHAPPSDDVVIRDAVQSGRALCEADGSLARVAELLRARDALTREYFEVARSSDEHAVAGELGAYMMLLAPLLQRRALVVDAGTGDGGLLDVLSPLFQRVVAVDRSAAQLAVARGRATRRGYKNVELIQGELRGAEVQDAVHRSGPGADAVFAVRLLHHAPQPERLLRDLLTLCAPGGVLIVLDYAAHGDERMRERADLWLGFSPPELRKLAEAAGGDPRTISVLPVPPTLTGQGPDHHLPWQLLSVQRPTEAAAQPKPEPEQRTPRLAPRLAPRPAPPTARTDRPRDNPKPSTNPVPTRRKKGAHHG